MLLSAFVMPFFAFLYFGYLGQTNIDPRLFYKWSAFGCTLFIILPFILSLQGQRSSGLRYKGQRRYAVRLQ